MRALPTQVSFVDVDQQEWTVDVRIDETMVDVRGRYMGKEILVRHQGDDRTLMHELLHCVLGDTFATKGDPQSHRLVIPIVKTLWDAGFRLSAATEL